VQAKNIIAKRLHDTELVIIRQVRKGPVPASLQERLERLRIEYEQAKAALASYRMRQVQEGASDHEGADDVQGIEVADISVDAPADDPGEPGDGRSHIITRGGGYYTTPKRARAWLKKCGDRLPEDQRRRY
jgi:hypothetical protein